MNERSLDFSQLLQGLSLLRDALGKSANLQTAASRSNDPPDLPVTIFLRDQRYSPTVALVFPGDGAEKHRSSSRHLVYVVNKAPPQLTTRWRNSAQSFIDLQGTVFIEVPGLVIDKKVARLRAEPSSPLAVDPFADKASNISRWLLTHPMGHAWGVRELSSLANVSLGTASKIVRTLEKRGVIIVSRKGRHATVSVDNPRKLFNAWAAVYDWTRNPALRVNAPVAEPKSFVKSLPDRFAPLVKKWALTLQSGAALVAPHAVWDQVHVYLDVSSTLQLKEIAARLNWQPTPDGRVTLMRPYYKSSVWPVSTKGGIPVVGDLQLALDLWHYPVRGREQAEHLLRKELPWLLPRHA